MPLKNGDATEETMPSRPWPSRIIRTFAALNLFFGTTGLFFLVNSVLHFWKRNVFNSQQPYLVPVYYAMTTINLIILAVLLTTPVPLWRLKRRALVVCNFLFGFELVYCVGSVAVAMPLTLSGNEKAVQLGVSMGGASGIGDMGINLQLLTAYPVIALVALNLAYRRLGRATNLPEGPEAVNQ